jgi:hypothetical protein
MRFRPDGTDTGVAGPSVALKYDPFLTLEIRLVVRAGRRVHFFCATPEAFCTLMLVVN